MNKISFGTWIECESLGEHGGDTFYVDVADLAEFEREEIAEWIESAKGMGRGVWIPRRIWEIVSPYAINGNCVHSTCTSITNRGGYGIKDENGLCAELFDTESEAVAALESMN